MSSFDELVNAAATGTVQAPADWMQGRTAFGGLVTAAGFHAAEAEAKHPKGPVTVVARMFAPIPPGQFSVAVETLRTGRSISAYSTRISQDGLCAVVDTTFARPRLSNVTVTPPAIPDGPAPSELPAIPFIKELMPAFLQHFEVRWLDGGIPGSNHPDPIAGGWCRHGTTATGPGALLALIDAWPPPVLGMSSVPFAASTVQLTAHLTGEPLGADGWTRFRCRAITANEGYVTTIGNLWASDGRLLGWMEQLVAVYDKV